MGKTFCWWRCTRRQRSRMPSSRLGLAGVVAAVALSVVSIVLLPAGAQTQSNSWISTWTASPQSPRGVMPTSFSNRTVRQIVRVSIGGNKVRIRLSNEFGTKPVLIGAASIGPVGGVRMRCLGKPAPAIGGSNSIILQPGAPALSDPVQLSVAALSDVAVNLYLPAATDLGTVHQVGLQDGLRLHGGRFHSKLRVPNSRHVRKPFFPGGGDGRAQFRCAGDRDVR